MLFSLENELNEQEFREYSGEVIEALDILEEEVEELQGGNPKND
jgi:hypothetical protein